MLGGLGVFPLVRLATGARQENIKTKNTYMNESRNQIKKADDFAADKPITAQKSLQDAWQQACDKRGEQYANDIFPGGKPADKLNYDLVKAARQSAARNNRDQGAARKLDQSKTGESNASREVGNSPVRVTRFNGLGYSNIAPSLWRIVDISTNSAACVGPYYKTKAELLCDLNRYAAQFFGTEAAQ